jgi:hypothetical protein
MEMPFAGLASFSSLPVVHCGSAGLCARPPVQRLGGHPARAYAGHERCLWHHSPPELCRVARQLSGLGARLSFGGRRASHSASYTAARRAHTCGREAAALAVRRRVRGLSKPHVAPSSQALLGTAPEPIATWTPRGGNAFEPCCAAVCRSKDASASSRQLRSQIISKPTSVSRRLYVAGVSRKLVCDTPPRLRLPSPAERRPGFGRSVLINRRIARLIALTEDWLQSIQLTRDAFG